MYAQRSDHVQGSCYVSVWLGLVFRCLIEHYSGHLWACVLDKIYNLNGWILNKADCSNQLKACLKILQMRGGLNFFGLRLSYWLFLFLWLTQWKLYGSMAVLSGNFLSAIDSGFSSLLGLLIRFCVGDNPSVSP